MSAHPPPVPPDQVSPKGGSTKPDDAITDPGKGKPRTPYVEDQGRHGNINENTHNEGYQQDR